MSPEIEPVVFELIVRGSVAMLLPFLFAFARDSEFLLSRTPYDQPNDFHAHLRLMRKIEGDHYDFGQIRIQAIPDDRVQLWFSSESFVGDKEVDLDNEEFGGFCQGLFAELVRLGFIIPAPEEKPHIGFRTEDES